MGRKARPNARVAKTCLNQLIAGGHAAAAGGTMTAGGDATAMPL